MRNEIRTREYKQKRKYQSGAQQMEEIFQDRTLEEKGISTYQSGVSVQISTYRKKQKPQPDVQDWTCACGSNTHMRRLSNQCPWRHWLKNEIDEFNCTKIVPSKFQNRSENELEGENNEFSLRQYCTEINTK